MRCQRCHERHHRRPPLLATIRGVEILVPLRIGARKAREGGIARGGMWWRAPAVDGRDVILRCRRCDMLARVPRVALERAARSAVTGDQARTLLLSASRLTMAAAAL